MNHDETQLNLPEREERVLKFWEANQIFEKTLEKTKKGKKFVFYEGPPFANGHPGIHHMETRVFKDAFVRYKTMQGFFVRRKAGWDTHGLPAELQVEKELGLKNKKDIERYGIAAFNQKCRESVWKYKEEWELFTKRIGFWLDLKNPYVTYDTPYIESLWFIIQKLWEKKALYKDYKIIPWCSRCGTGLSSHELGQPGAYRTLKDPSIYVKFKLKDRKNEYALIWTTTPWTLPGNVAVAVNPKIEYVRYESNGESFWSVQVPPGMDPASAKEKVLGKTLLGLQYEAPYLTHDAHIPYTILAGDFVEATEGTGFVHIAPAFGEDDMAVVKKEFGEKYPILHTVTEEGTMEKGIVGEGLFVKEADKIVIEDLKNRKILFRTIPYTHEYPHCWRCDTPLIYLARESWWVKKPVEELLKENKKVNWVPEYLKDGRFGEWLREKKDWAFSRERYWGTPLPVWECKKCPHKDVVGSLHELIHKAAPSSNKYILMRHGESEANILGVISDSNNTYHLTDRGKKQVEKSAAKLKKEKIDFIIASDVLRARETAEKVAATLGIKVIFDSRLREIHLGVLNGTPSSGYHAAFPTYEDKFTKHSEGGESLSALRARMSGFIKEIDAKYSNKKILIISHEYPIWIMWAAGQGMSTLETTAIKKKLKDKDFVTFAETKKFSYKKLPYSHTGTVDLHRPFIDEFVFPCTVCGGEMHRVPDVCDVWFDSGAMPYAQDHWPFQTADGKPVKKIDAKKKPEYFPADFICEGVDQTRGWFYTLLTISTLLGFKAPYRNVMSLGHVLDKNGQKMSKSKGNVVSPEEMIQKYGVDSLRWYFYTINGPGDPKAFDEKDLAVRLRGFLSTFWNSYVLFETYAPVKVPVKGIPSSKNILDKWIISHLHGLIADVTRSLEGYDPVNAARAIEVFLIGQFSQWYLRRSRRRFQKPKNPKELMEASQVSAYVMLELVKLSAPLTPFFSEILFQRLRGKVGVKEMSVHFTSWPKAVKKLRNEKIEKEMTNALAATAQALQKRAQANMKVRQPLQSFTIPKAMKFSFSEIVDIIRDEINVKEIQFGPEYNLDIMITPELREEGVIREIMRNIQEMRKDGGFKPGEGALVQFDASEKGMLVLKKWTSLIQAEVGAKNVQLGGKRIFTVERELTIEHENFWIGIRKP